MIRLPQNRIFQQSNNPYFGDIFYSKNIDLDEEGKIRLSPRAVSVVNSETTAAFSLPIAFGVRSNGQYLVVTAINPFTSDLRASNDVSASEDTDAGDDAPPDFNTDAHGVWWQGRWYVVDSITDIVMYKTIASGDWTDTAIAVTEDKRHPLCVNVNRQTLCIGNGNQVLQYTTGHVADSTLTIPADFEVTKLAYNNKSVGVVTKPSVPSTGQNVESYFFLWNGEGTSPGQSFAVGAGIVYDIIPYKSSFALITQAGEHLYFNGGGFTKLVNLPVFFKSFPWTDSTGLTTSSNPMMLGNIMIADGDNIHINLNGATEQQGARGEQYLYNQPGGLWTYDPKVGIYHRISPSISACSYLAVANTGVNTTTNVITKNTGTIPTTGSPIKYVEGPTDLIGGLTIGTVYYCIKIDSSTFKLATTKALAEAGTAIDLTTQATGTSGFLALELKDYGQSFYALSGGAIKTDTNDLVRDNFVFGGSYQDSNSTTSYSHFNLTVRGFKNIGYFVTPKLFAQEVLAAFGKGFIKHKRLRTGDSIEIKVQNEELPGLPVTTPQHGLHCTWTDTNTFTTTANLSEAKTHYDAGVKLECEIIAGAGSGQMSQISSITESSGTYTVNLTDNLEGVAASDICDIKIENWRSLGVYTNTNKSVIEFPTGEHTSWASFKIILQGVEVAIEEIQFTNAVYKPSV